MKGNIRETACRSGHQAVHLLVICATNVYDKTIIMFSISCCFVNMVWEWLWKQFY